VAKIRQNRQENHRIIGQRLFAFLRFRQQSLLRLLVITGDVHRDQNDRAVTGDFLGIVKGFRELLFRFVDDTKRPETGTVRV
jgi:hypothetical protein